VSGLKPQMQFDVAGLENGADRGAELQLALQAALEPRTRRLAANHGNTINATTMRAYGTVRPHDGLKALVGRLLAVEMRLRKDAHDSDSNSLSQKLDSPIVFVKYIPVSRLQGSPNIRAEGR